jgi:hypothetical protein
MAVATDWGFYVICVGLTLILVQLWWPWIVVAMLWIGLVHVLQNQYAYWGSKYSLVTGE